MHTLNVPNILDKPPYNWIYISKVYHAYNGEKASDCTHHSDYCIYLDTLGNSTQNEINPTCIAPPKEAKASGGGARKV